MGCHTWFYKKIEKPSYEEMKQFILKKYYDSVEGLNKWINNPLDEEYLEMSSVYTEWTIEYLKQWRDVDLRRIRLIENDYCKVAVMNKYCSYSDDILVPVNNNIYKDVSGVNGYHDVFRKYGYPNDMLFSLEETLNYINNTENECVIYENSIELIKKFWNEYPDGMIDFG